MRKDVKMFEARVGEICARLAQMQDLLSGQISHRVFMGQDDWLDNLDEAMNAAVKCFVRKRHVRIPGTFIGTINECLLCGDVEGHLPTCLMGGKDGMRG